MPVPASASSTLGASRRSRGAKAWAAAAAKARWPSRVSDPAPVSCASRASASPSPSRMTRAGGRSAALLPRLQPREQHSLAPLGPRQPLADQPCPAPSDPVQRRIDGPRAFTRRPAFVGQRRQQSPGDRRQQPRRRRFVGRRFQPDERSQSRHRRDHEARRVDKGEQLEKVEPADFRIAEALPGERGVEKDVRRVRDRPDRFAPPGFPRAIGPDQPDAGVRRVECGKRENGSHRPSCGGEGTKGQRRTGGAPDRWSFSGA